MDLKIKQDNKKCCSDLSNVKVELCLRESYDKTGVNVCADVSGHPSAKENRRHYLLRFMKDGSVKLFKDNFNLGFDVDEEGVLEFFE